MVNGTQPLPIYKEPLLYTGVATLVGLCLLIYTFLPGNVSSSLMTTSMIILLVFGATTYFLWDTRCPHCKRSFVKKEDHSKEKDLGTRKSKRYFVSEIHKTRDGEVVDEIEDYKMWPARYVQRYFYCKKCEYGKNDEWHDDDKGTFKGWEDNAQWNPPKAKVILVREDEDGNYVRASSKKKRIPLKTSLRKELLNRADNACQTCGTHDALDVHHIDENPANNNNKNLIILCASCHRKVGSKSKLQLRNMALKPYKKSQTINIYK